MSNGIRTQELPKVTENTREEVSGKIITEGNGVKENIEGPTKKILTAFLSKTAEDSLEQISSRLPSLKSVITRFKPYLDIPTLARKLATFHPGVYSLKWLLPDDIVIQGMSEERLKEINEMRRAKFQKEEDDLMRYFRDEEFDGIDVGERKETLYLVKWKNLSYTQATWECESALNPQKLNYYRKFNKSIGRDARMLAISQYKRHKVL